MYLAFWHKAIHRHELIDFETEKIVYNTPIVMETQ